MPKEIYLDHAAATPIDPRVIAVMSRAMRELGNPSSFNDAGRRASRILEDSRKEVARFLNAHLSEIVFCASGSEANALALAGARRILTQPTEHTSVLQSAGTRARFIRIDHRGVVDAKDITKAFSTNTDIVSVMYANNEIGTIQPIKQIAKVIREWRKKNRSVRPLFHVDACQATAYLPMDVQALGVDLLTLNGSKVYGPRGVAVLYVRRGVELTPLVRGGSQEHGRRAGTENVAGAVGLAKAVSLIRTTDADRTAKLRDQLIAGILQAMPGVRLNGPTGESRLANNINISIPGVTSEELLLELDKHGIRAGSGSACTAHSVEPSHVLKAIGTPKKYLSGTLRFSLSQHTTKADIDAVIHVLPKVASVLQKRKLE